MVCRTFGREQAEGDGAPFSSQGTTSAEGSGTDRGSGPGGSHGERELIHTLSPQTGDREAQLQQLRALFTKGATGLLVSLYPMESEGHAETLNQEQQKHFNRMLTALVNRLSIEGIQSTLLDLGPFDGIIHPHPFPDLHWDIATCWMLIDGTLPSIITLNDGSTIEYSQTIMRDPSCIQRWRKKLDYARTGFRAR